METEADEAAPAVRTFLIADVRGYTRFTRAHGDEAAARLAKRFADLTRDAVEARRGRVIELRGDEALAVFGSTAQAVRAAVEFQAICAEDTAADPALPLTVGIGIDVGEAVPVEDGFRGLALNTAARLCSRALSGQILVTRAVADAAADVDGVALEEIGPAELKGFETPLDVIAAVSTRAPLADVRRVPPTELPPELDPLTPLVGREGELHWLRGTWRQARRGRGRIVVVSGPSQIGKTRLVAELAAEVADGGSDVIYAGSGGAALALALAAVRRATAATEATLVVLDDLDVVGEEAARAVADAHDAIADRSVMVVATVKDPVAGPALASAVEQADGIGDGHVSLPAFALEGAQGIARLYVGEDVEHVPLESMVRASGGLPGRLHEVVSEWARDEAGRRLAAAAEWLSRGRDRRSADLEFANNAIGLGLTRLYAGAPPVPGDAECPYKGLASFEESDAASFFGRERLVGELAARTVHVGLLGVVGASGSGKSSVLAGGLFPSLRAGLLPGSERWRTVRFRPGEHPMAELERAVGGRLADAIEASGPDGRLVLAVDQFEEVFTLSGEEEREVFIDEVTLPARTTPDRFVVVLTIRDDFYGHCAPYRDLAEVLVANHVLVPPMTVEELRRAIELPARRARLRIEADLVDALVAEVADEPGGLPLLSAALVELWQAREDGWLRMDAYERTGGVRGAVARLAEASCDELTLEERDVARRLFLRLASVGEGDVVTRRRVDLAELEVETDPVAARVVGRLTADRLLVSTGSTVEVAHEALLREWPRLRSWLDDDLQGHRLRQHLTQAARQWDASGRDGSELYRGARLSGALDFASTHGSDLNELERAFLAESREGSEHEAGRQRRTNRRLRGLLVGTAVFLIVSLVAGGLALVQRGRARDEADRAEREARVATARELAAASVSNLEVDTELSILLALEAVETTRAVDGTVLREAHDALHRAVIATRTIVTTPDTAEQLDFDPRSGSIVTAMPDGSLVSRDPKTGIELRSFGFADGMVTGLSIRSDGGAVATSREDGSLQIWDMRSGDAILELPPTGVPLLSVEFTPRGDAFATIDVEGTVSLRSAPDGVERWRTTVWSVAPQFPFGELLAFAPDGGMLGVASAGSVEMRGGFRSATVLETTMGRTALRLGPVAFPSHGVAFSPNGRLVATAHADGSAIFWDPLTGTRELTISSSAGTNNIYDVDFSPDGTLLATGGLDGVIRVWELEPTGAREILTLFGHSTAIKDVAFNEEGSILASGSDDGTTRIWDLTPGGSREVFTAVGPVLIGDVAFDPSGRTLFASTSPDGTVGVWDLRDRTLARELRHPDGASVFGIDVDPTGSTVATASLDRTVKVWDARSGVELMSLMAAECPPDVDLCPVFDVRISADGRSLATGAADGTARTFDLRSGREQLRLDAHSDNVFGIDLSPTGAVLATASWDGTAKLWNVENGNLIATLDDRDAPVSSVAFSPNGELVATGGFDGGVNVFETFQWRPVQRLQARGSVFTVAFSPDGRYLVSGGDFVRIWDVETGHEVGTVPGTAVRVTYSPDGSELATSENEGGPIRVWLLDVDQLLELARDRLTRGFTEQECGQYQIDPCPAAG